MSRIGLRGRLVAALASVAIVSLAVTAASLLPPLQHRLVTEQLNALVEVARVSAGALRAMEADDLRPGSPALRDEVKRIARRTGGRVAIFGPDGVRLADSDPDAPGADSFSDVARARGAGRPVRERDSGSDGQARVSVPVQTDNGVVTVALRRPLRDVGQVAGVVRRGFLTAAAVALAVALVLGAALATTLVGRLRRLRDAGRRLAAEGLRVEIPHDRAHDELGDLARTLDVMRARLQAEEETRKAFLATASHELRTPLASLSGMLELAQDDLEGDPPDVRDALLRLHAAREQGRRLTQLAVDLLDITRLDSHVPLRREPVELREVARAVAAEFAARAGDAGVRIVTSSANGGGWATGDPGAVARIARILLDNALRFAPPGSAVDLEVDGPRLVVADAGPGIPPADRERVFGRFERGSASGDDGGFGLGLAIGSELAARMGGSLELLDGPGARFALTLPS
jgi:signal transduction histidine kinase